MKIFLIFIFICPLLSAMSNIEKINQLATIAKAIGFNYNIYKITDDENKKIVFGPAVDNQLFSWITLHKKAILNKNTIQKESPEEKGIERFLCYTYPPNLQNTDTFDYFINRFIDSLNDTELTKLIDRAETPCQLDELTKIALNQYMYNLLEGINILIPPTAVYAFKKKLTKETTMSNEILQTSIRNIFQELSSTIAKDRQKSIEAFEKPREKFVKILSKNLINTNYL